MSKALKQIAANLDRLQRMEKNLTEFVNRQVNLEEKDYDMIHETISSLGEMIKVEKIKKLMAERAGK